MKRKQTITAPTNCTIQTGQTLMTVSGIVARIVKMVRHFHNVKRYSPQYGKPQFLQFQVLVGVGGMIILGGVAA